jgi:hypothetical protein
MLQQPDGVIVVAAGADDAFSDEFEHTSPRVLALASGG